MDRAELGTFLFTAERFDRGHPALAVLLGLNGLRVSEACGTNIEDLAVQRGHRTLRIVGKGNKPATIPLVPRTARTIDLSVGECHEGPILRRKDGQIRTWSESENCFKGWYVNLEAPWVRSTVGFDSRDDILDVTVSHDLSDTSLRDEDELDFACQVGVVTRGEARSIRLTADSAIEDVSSRRWPFREAAWSEFSPPDYDAMNVLPPGWDDP